MTTLRLAAVLGLLAAATSATACSSETAAPTSTSSSASSGGSGAGGSPDAGGTDASGGAVLETAPRGIVVATVTAGTHTAGECPEAGAKLAIGALPSAFVVDGSDEGAGGRRHSVSCKVASKGAGFVASVQIIEVMDDAGGSFQLKGDLDASGASAIGSATLAVPGINVTSARCTFRPAADGIAAGRYGVTVTCPDALVIGSSGHTCALEAELRIENCAQGD